LINVITITKQVGSGGSKLARRIAHKLRWELVDDQLVDRIARIADLDGQTATQLDEQAVRWWHHLLEAGSSIAASSPHVTPRWLGDIDAESVHDLAVELIRTAADSGGCVIVGRGAQCVLQDRGDVLHVLAHAPIEERVRALRIRYPESADVEVLLKQVDLQQASYIGRHYGKDWLDPSLYHVSVNTSLGLDAAATLVHTAVICTARSCTPYVEEEVSLCHWPRQL
jgi:cytidylate kinase